MRPVERLKAGGRRVGALLILMLSLSSLTYGGALAAPAAGTTTKTATTSASTGTVTTTTTTSAATSTAAHTTATSASVTAANRPATVPFRFHVGKIAGIMPAPSRAAEARKLAAAGSGPLLYHGGPTMHTNQIYAIYWVPSGYSVSGTYESLVNGYFQNVAADNGKTSNVYNTDTQYYDNTSGHILYQSGFVTSVVDTNALPMSGCTDFDPFFNTLPVCLTDAQLQTEIQNVVAANGWTPSLTTEFFLFTAAGIGSCFDSGSSQCAYSTYCAYHSNTGASGNLIYSNMPYAFDQVGTNECLNSSAGQTTPTGDPAADAVINVTSHEQNESITDPQPNTGWVDSTGNENGDKCAWNFGSTIGTAPNGQAYNQKIGSGYYDLQQEWSNADNGCALRYPALLPPTVTGLSPNSGPSSGGTTVTISGSNFSGATSATFGGTPGLNLTVVSDNQIAVNSPGPMTPGPVDVLITTPGGTSTATAADRFTYLPPAPSITSISPTSGSSAGGTSVTINGSNLNGATAVHFGFSLAGTFAINSDSVITAIAPAGLAGNAVGVSVTTPGGTASGGSTFLYVQPTNPAGGAYHPLPPQRIYDTRNGPGALQPGLPRTLQISGPGSPVPSGASAVVLNVAVTDTTAASFLTVYPADASRPNAANLNWVAGQTVPNLVEVKLSPSGQISMFSPAGTVDVVLDVQGYVGADGTSLFNALPPARIYDSRNGPGALGPNATHTVQIAGLGGVPTGATAVVMNVAVTDTTAPSYLAVYPSDKGYPGVANLNWNAGLTVPNRVMVPLGPDGKVTLLNRAGSVDVILDVNGYFISSSGAVFTGLTPARILDTRPGDQVQSFAAPLCANSSYDVQVAGMGGVPIGASAVVLNVAVTDTTDQSYLAAYPFGTIYPGISDLNWTAGRTVPNLVVAKVGTGGKVTFFNRAGCTDIVADVVGYYS